MSHLEQAGAERRSGRLRKYHQDGANGSSQPESGLYGSKIGENVSRAAAAEMVGTFILVFTGTAVAVAATLAVGPMIVAGKLTSFWLYIVGPLVGGAIAALFYGLVKVARRPDD